MAENDSYFGRELATSGIGLEANDGRAECICCALPAAGKLLSICSCNGTHRHNGFIADGDHTPHKRPHVGGRDRGIRARGVFGFALAIGGSRALVLGNGRCSTCLRQKVALPCRAPVSMAKSANARKLMMGAPRSW